MIDKLLAGLLGFLFGRAFFAESPKKKESKGPLMFYVWFRAEESDDHYIEKGQLEFYSYEEAHKWYDKLVKNKQISIKDIMDNSQLERDLRKSMEEAAKKDGKPLDEINETTMVKLVSVGWGLENSTFDEKEL